MTFLQLATFLLTRPGLSLPSCPSGLPGSGPESWLRFLSAEKRGSPEAQGTAIQTLLPQFHPSARPADCALRLHPDSLHFCPPPGCYVPLESCSVCYVVSCVHAYGYHSLTSPCLDFSTCFRFPPLAWELLVHPGLAHAWPNQYFLNDGKAVGKGDFSK